MITLGIHDGHNASACLMQDGKILACVQEERLYRKKNCCGFPKQAIQECLKIGQIEPNQVDWVGVAGVIPPIRKIEDVISPKGFRKLYGYARHLIPRSILNSACLTRWGVSVLSKFRDKKGIRQQLNTLGIHASMAFYDHHQMHALSAYGASPFFHDEEKVLVLTCDGSGDAVCATVNIGENGKMERLHTTYHAHSLGEFYARLTQYMGMTPLSDEYKVMGLAAYANEKYGLPAYKKVKGLISVDPNGFGLVNNTAYTKWAYPRMFHRLFKNDRFDCIAYGVQRMTEELLTEWVLNAVKKTGLHKVVLSGGVFMNIKANKVILNLKDIERLWVLPSCSDDSLSIGAAMQASLDQGYTDIKPLEDLYLGPAYSDEAIEQALLEYAGQFSVQKLENIEEHIGQEIARGKIIGRFAGRMEFGSRALGNRSILADPRDMRTVSKINQAIKKREFWMPYCPSILAERADDFFERVKDYDAFYMVMAFPATQFAYENIPAPMHAYDHTIRPQLVTKEWNLGYHKVISAFEKETGVGALLNTSFNLSGHPVVCTPQDALDVFTQSDLSALALENYYIVKTK